MMLHEKRRLIHSVQQGTPKAMEAKSARAAAQKSCFVCMEDLAEGLRYRGKAVASLRGCAFFGVRSWGYQWAHGAELPQVSDSRYRP